MFLDAKEQANGDRGSVAVEEGEDSFDESDFYDAVEEHTNQIERASVEIYNDYVKREAAKQTEKSKQ